LIFGPFEPITPVDLNMPTPPDPTPPPTVKVPVVTVQDFDGIITPDNWDMSWTDGNGNLTHIFTKNSSIYVQITNSAGMGQTGKYRRVI
jgi:hypothetical protein